MDLLLASPFDYGVPHLVDTDPARKTICGAPAGPVQWDDQNHAVVRYDPQSPPRSLCRRCARRAEILARPLTPAQQRYLDEIRAAGPDAASLTTTT